MTYDQHTFSEYGVCVDCGAPKFNAVYGGGPKKCVWPPPGCEDPDPYDRSHIRTIPHTPLTDADRRALAAGVFPDWHRTA